MPEGMEDVVWGWLLDVVASLFAFCLCVPSHSQFQTVYPLYVNVGESGIFCLFLMVNAAIVSSEDRTDSIG